jgi:hypothetical protein
VWQNSCSVDMEIALCYMYTIVPVPYRYRTGSRGSVPVSAVRSSNPSSTCSTRPSTGTVRTGRNPGNQYQVLPASRISPVIVGQEKVVSILLAPFEVSTEVDKGDGRTLDC